MKLSELLQRLETVRQEHGDFDVYIGFPDFPGEGRVDGELDEVEFESYDPNDASDKGLMLWAHTPALLEWDQPSVAHPAHAQVEVLEVLQWVSSNYAATLEGMSVRGADECLVAAARLLAQQQPALALAARPENESEQILRQGFIGSPQQVAISTPVTADPETPAIPQTFQGSFGDGGPT